MEIEGIENVDPNERKRQHLLTKALWEQLNSNGNGVGKAGQIECILFAPTEEAAAQIAEEYNEGFDISTNAVEGSNDICITLVSPICEFTEEAFLELTDIMLVSASYAGAVFDGFQVDVNALQNIKKPWWKFW